MHYLYDYLLFILQLFYILSAVNIFLCLYFPLTVFLLFFLVCSLLTFEIKYKVKMMHSFEKCCLLNVKIDSEKCLFWKL